MSGQLPREPDVQAMRTKICLLSLARRSYSTPKFAVANSQEAQQSDLQREESWIVTSGKF